MYTNTLETFCKRYLHQIQIRGCIPRRHDQYSNKNVSQRIPHLLHCKLTARLSPWRTLGGLCQHEARTPWDFWQLWTSACGLLAVPRKIHSAFSATITQPAPSPTKNFGCLWALLSLLLDRERGKGKRPRDILGTFRETLANNNARVKQLIERLQKISTKGEGQCCKAQYTYWAWKNQQKQNMPGQAPNSRISHNARHAHVNRFRMHFPHPSRIMVAGPSCSGKTTFVIDLLFNHSQKFFKKKA